MSRRPFNGDFSQVQGLLRANWLGRDDHPCGANRLSHDNHPRGRGSEDAGYPDHGREDDYHGCHGRPLLSDGTSTHGHGRAPHGPGCLARPDCNRRPFLPDVQCAACKWVGQVAKHCDMLATAICLERYMKHNMSPTLRNSIEKEWLDCWKERLGNPTQTPRQVLRAYVDELDITVAGLDNQMEWDYWDEDDADNPQLK
jgi:hypothetical protein